MRSVQIMMEVVPLERYFGLEYFPLLHLHLSITSSLNKPKALNKKLDYAKYETIQNLH